MRFWRYAAYYTVTRTMFAIVHRALALLGGALIVLLVTVWASPAHRPVFSSPILTAANLPSLPLPHLTASTPRPDPSSSVYSEVCFVPGEDCGAVVAGEFDRATTSIRLQAYTFSSPRIAQALARAAGRSVAVDVILDAREARHPSEANALSTLARANITTLLDNSHGIAHNKIAIIDSATIITGSFNFSIAAERENAENVVILRHCPNLAHLYLSNFEFHFSHSHPL